MNTESTSADNASRRDGSALSDGLGPLLEGWANVGGVRFVSRSYGQYTTATVSRDGLLDLMRAVQAADRERWAIRCEALAAGEPHKWTAKTLRDLADEMRA